MQVYEVTGGVVDTSVTARGVHEIAPPVGPLTVQSIVPAGWNVDEPVRVAVSVVVPPSVGELEAVREIVGTNVEIPRVTVLESTNW